MAKAALRPALDPARRPTVLQVLPEMKAGGVERGTIEIAGALARHGYRALVASAGGPLVKKLAYAGAEHIELPLASKNPFRMWGNIGLLESVIREYGVDIVHARSRAPAWSAYYAARRCKVPFVTTFHGIYNIQNKYKRLYNSIMTKGDVVIAISEFGAAHIRENYHVTGKPMTVIHRGVDLAVFNPGLVAQRRLIDLAKTWRMPDDQPIIMLPGRITRWKGQEFLIRALARMKEVDFFCILAGDHEGHPGYRTEIEKAIVDLGLGHRVRIVGNTQDMAAAYLLAHVVVSASLEPEAFGRVAIEAQAMGRPIIATSHGGSTETVIHGETGWLVTPGSEEEMERALREALSLPQSTLQAIGHAGMEHVRHHFSSELMCQKELAIYDQLLGSRR